MQLSEEETLRSCDHEDIDDVVTILVKAFNIPADRLAGVATINDLAVACELSSDKYEGGCTTQQAFYKIRKCLEGPNTKTLAIKPNTPLQAFMSSKNLYKKVEAFKQQLGIDVDLLSIKDWPSNIIALLGLAAFICCFFNIVFAAILLLTCMVTYIISKRFFVELSIKTAGELANKITQQHYMQARRHTGTINKQEIFNLVQHIFSDRLAIDKAVLTRDTVLYQ